MKKKIGTLLLLVTLINSQSTATPETLLLKDAKNGALSLSTDFLTELKHLFNPHVFIETGTFAGETTKNAAKIFPEVHSIEPSETFSQEVKTKLASENNVHLYHGNSALVLPVLLSTLPKNRKMVFWLDSHYRAGMAKKESNTSVMQELAAIKKSGIRDAIILVDDVCCFQPFKDIPQDSEAHGFPTIAQLRDALLAINPFYEFVIYGDIALAFPRYDNVVPSAFLKACTTSRLFDSDNTIPIEKLIEAEYTIAEVKGTERDSLNHLLWRKKWTGVYYHLWISLGFLYQSNFDMAHTILTHAFNNGLRSWHVSWHKAHALYHQGKKNEALSYLRTIIQERPDFNGYASRALLQLTKETPPKSCYFCKLLSIGKDKRRKRNILLALRAALTGTKIPRSK